MINNINIDAQVYRDREPPVGGREFLESQWKQRFPLEWTTTTIFYLDFRTVMSRIITVTSGSFTVTCIYILIHNVSQII